MGFLSKIAGEVTLSGVKGVFEGIGSLAGDIRSAITGELKPEQQVEIIQKINELEAQAKLGQVEINKVEAQHRSIFVAGARPFIMWICGTSIGLYFIPQYAMATVLWVRMCWNASELVAFPIPEPVGLFNLVVALLGLGTMRMVEKLTGKTL